MGKRDSKKKGEGISCENKSKPRAKFAENEERRRIIANWFVKAARRNLLHHFNDLKATRNEANLRRFVVAIKSLDQGIRSKYKTSSQETYLREGTDSLMTDFIKEYGDSKELEEFFAVLEKQNEKYQIPLNILVEIVLSMYGGVETKNKDGKRFPDDIDSYFKGDTYANVRDTLKELGFENVSAIIKKNTVYLDAFQRLMDVLRKKEDIWVI